MDIDDLLTRLDPDLGAAKRYFERGVFGFNNAVSNTDIKVRSVMTALAVYACISLKEALIHQANDSGPDKGSELLNKVLELPFLSTLEDVRNLDIHGRPIPVCDPSVYMSAMVSGKKQMELTSSNGVGVQVQMVGAKPKVRLSPKQQNHGKFTPGDAVSYECIDGRLGVHHFPSAQTYDLLEMIRAFLVAAAPLVEIPKQDVTDLPATEGS